MTPLVPRPRAAVAVATLGLVVLVGLAVLVHGRSNGVLFDDAVRDRIDALSPPTRSALLGLTTPALTIGLLAMIAFVAALLRRWDVLALTAAAPLITTLLTEFVLKPIVRRTNTVVLDRFGQHSWAYPSGHESGLAGLTAVVGLLVLRTALGRGVKIVVVSLLLVTSVLGAIGLVGAYYHFATDTIGSMALSIVAVVACALVIDRFGVRTGAAPAGRPSPAADAVPGVN